MAPVTNLWGVDVVILLEDRSTVVVSKSATVMETTGEPVATVISMNVPLAALAADVASLIMVSFMRTT